MSRLALDGGAAGCMLSTDAANPTSNAVYRRIGYRQVGRAGEYRFRYQPTQPDAGRAAGTRRYPPRRRSPLPSATVP